MHPLHSSLALRRFFILSFVLGYGLLIFAFPCSCSGTQSNLFTIKELVELTGQMNCTLPKYACKTIFPHHCLARGSARLGILGYQTTRLSCILVLLVHPPSSALSGQYFSKWAWSRMHEATEHGFSRRTESPVLWSGSGTGRW